MKVTIIPADKKIKVDGVLKRVPEAPWETIAPVHAVQFDGTSGHIEWVALGGARRLNNQPINLDQFNAMFTPFVEAWQNHVD